MGFLPVIGVSGACVRAEEILFQSFNLFFKPSCFCLQNGLGVTFSFFSGCLFCFGHREYVRCTAAVFERGSEITGPRVFVCFDALT